MPKDHYKIKPLPWRQQSDDEYICEVGTRFFYVYAVEGKWIASFNNQRHPIPFLSEQAAKDACHEEYMLYLSSYVKPVSPTL